MKKETRFKKLTTAASMLMISSITLVGCSSIGGQSTGSYPAFGDDQFQRHAYAGLGLGLSRMQPTADLAPNIDVNDRVEGAGQITLGLDVNKMLALEAHSADLGSAGFSPTGRVNYHVHGASALFYAGKNRSNFKRRGFSGFGRVGYGFVENSTVGDVSVKHNSRHNVLLGAGLEYMTKVGLGLRAEAMAFEEDAGYMQLGMVYRTGKRRARRAVQIVKAPAPAPEPTPVPIPVPAVVVAQPVVEPAPVDTCQEFSGSLEGVNFFSNSADLTNDAKNVLDGVAGRLADCDSIPVQISAHTDSSGAANYNQQLSERRANSVANYLSGSGISRARLRVQAFGETQPIESNATAEGRKRNRRVELVTIQ